MTKITLKNNFHNSEIILNAKEKFEGLFISEGQMKKAKKTLCGIRGCECSNDFGVRGKQDYQEYVRNYWGVVFYI